MSIEAAKAFLEKVKTDEMFSEKVSECNGAEERMALAKAEGFDFTAEEIKDLGTELSDSDLDAVAGAGCRCKSIIHEGNFI